MISFGALYIIHGIHRDCLYNVICNCCFCGKARSVYMLELGTLSKRESIIKWDVIGILQQLYAMAMEYLDPSKIC